MGTPNYITIPVITSSSSIFEFHVHYGQIIRRIGSYTWRTFFSPATPSSTNVAIYCFPFKVIPYGPHIDALGNKKRGRFLPERKYGDLPLPIYLFWCAEFAEIEPK